MLRASRTGASINEIAAQVHLAPGTVRNYLSAAMTKLGVNSRHAAAHHAAPGKRAGSNRYPDVSLGQPVNPHTAPVRISF